jgi:hypothetical protein
MTKRKAKITTKASLSKEQCGHWLTFAPDRDRCG